MFNNKQYLELQYLCCYLPRLVGSLYLKTVVSWLRQVHSQMAGGWGTHFGPPVSLQITKQGVMSCRGVGNYFWLAELKVEANVSITDSTSGGGEHTSAPPVSLQIQLWLYYNLYNINVRSLS